MIGHLGTFHENLQHRLPHVRLSDDEYARATAGLPVLCTDLVLVDEHDRFVLSYRNHPCAQGWWWMGGSWKAEFTREESLEHILKREIGFTPSNTVLFACFDYFWVTRREDPTDSGRHEMIFLHYMRVSEEIISRITLDPNEYDAARGLLRYDGTQEVRPAVKEAYALFLSQRSKM